MTRKPYAKPAYTHNVQTHCYQAPNSCQHPWKSAMENSFRGGNLATKGSFVKCRMARNRWKEAFVRDDRQASTKHRDWGMRVTHRR